MSLEKVVALCEVRADRARIRSHRICIMTSRPEFSLRRGITPISKSLKAATTRAAFCVIPQFRGNHRSRRFESVIAEATRLFSQGVREINLIGQDTTVYGEDLGIKDGLAGSAGKAGADRNAACRSGSGSSTPIPIKSRRSSSIPSRSMQALAKYIDMPLQHASAPVLKRMKRGANGDIFLKLLERSERSVPGIASTHQLYRRISRRDRTGFRRAVPICRSREIRPDGCFFLFRRGFRARAMNWTAKWTDAPSTAGNAN